MGKLVWARRAVGALAIYGLAYRPWQLSWGATADEVSQDLPGDELIPHPLWEATRAITIAARTDQVWPWLVQIGAHPRAGWYSYDWGDNAGIPSATDIRPELQQLSVGDVLPMVAGSNVGWRVEAIDPGRALVLVNTHPDGVVTATFALRADAAGRSRLVHRVRFRVRLTPFGVAFSAMMDVSDFLMSRRMLLGIRDRAEHLARRNRGGPAPTDHRVERALEFDLSVPIARSPQEVYAALADVQALEPIPRSAGVRMTKSPPGPTHVGTGWDERVRLAPGLWMRIDSEATEVWPPWRLGMDFRSAWFEGHLDYEVEEAGGGSVLHQRETLALRPPLGVAQSYVDAHLRAHVLDRLADLRDVIESRG